jgi:hypothetical protein
MLTAYPSKRRPIPDAKTVDRISPPGTSPWISVGNGVLRTWSVDAMAKIPLMRSDELGGTHSMQFRGSQRVADG